MRSHAGAHGAKSQWHGISGHKAACRGRTIRSLFRANGRFAARRGGAVAARRVIRNSAENRD